MDEYVQSSRRRNADNHADSRRHSCSVTEVPLCVRGSIVVRIQDGEVCQSADPRFYEARRERATTMLGPRVNNAALVL